MIGAKQFKERATHEGGRYGDDPYVFLRELAQNARDAAATRIEVTLIVERGEEVLRFRDDGTGMSSEHARRFLFRLYASSKEGAGDSAGRFGVGFWSILRFEPTSFEIHSRVDDESWAVCGSGDLSNLEGAPACLPSRGTEIVLRRRVRSDRPSGDYIRDRLRHYCRFLHQRGAPSRPLAVCFEGETLNEPIELDSLVSLTFQGKTSRGAVGLGPEPRIELFSRGLWVGTVATLEELSAGTEGPRIQARGASPVAIVDSDEIDVVLARDGAVQDRNMKRLMREMRRRIDRVVAGTIDGFAPQGPGERVVAALRSAFEGWVMPLITMLVLGACLGAALVKLFAYHEHRGGSVGSSAAMLQREVATRPDETVPKTDRRRRTLLRSPVRGSSAGELLPSVLDRLGDYRGATIDLPRGSEESWPLHSDGRGLNHLRVLALGRYDAQDGWLAEPSADALNMAPRCGANCRKLKIGNANGVVVLPVPSGHLIVSGSFTLDGKPLAVAPQWRHGRILLEVPRSGELVYRTVPSAEARPPLVRGFDFPAPVRRRLHESRRSRPGRRVVALSRFVREALAYDNSSEAALTFRQTEGNWLSRVWRSKVGDCDVKNGFNAALLNAAGIPARLAVGLVTVDGTPRRGWHAWTEWYGGGRWHVADATGQGLRVAPTVAGAGLEPLALGPQEDTGPADGQSQNVDEDVETPAGGVEPFGEPVSAAQTIGEAELGPRLALGSLAALLLLVVGVVVVGQRRRDKEALAVLGNLDDSAALVAEMIRALASGSQGFDRHSPLWRRHVLPTLRGHRLALEEALRLARQGRLWLGHRDGALAQAVASAGSPVLDRSDPIFGALMASAFRATHLDSLEKLAPGSLALPQELAPVADFLDRETGIALHGCAGDVALREVDLRALPRSIPHPRHYVAIGLATPEVMARLALLRRCPRTGFFAWLDWIIDTTPSLEGRAGSLRSKAALESLRLS